MIRISVDEAEAFDRLSILNIKHSTGLKVYMARALIAAEIEEQVSNWKDVLASAEYAALKAANLANFEAVELANDNGISAQELQRLNHRRFAAKKVLQERFWPDKQLTEAKSQKAQDIDTKAV